MAIINYHPQDLGPVNEKGRIQNHGIDLYAVVETNVNRRSPASLGVWGALFDNLEEAITRRDAENEYYGRVGRTFAVARANLSCWEIVL